MLIKYPATHNPIPFLIIGGKYRGNDTARGWLGGQLHINLPGAAMVNANVQHVGGLPSLPLACCSFSFFVQKNQYPFCLS